MAGYCSFPVTGPHTAARPAWRNDSTNRASLSARADDIIRRGISKVPTGEMAAEQDPGVDVLSRQELDVLVRMWQRERSLPAPNPDELAQVLLDALADHWD